MSSDVPGLDPGRVRPSVSITDSHTTTVAGFSVRRALPQRGRRTVGAWCFADHMGPMSVTESQGLDVGPHPHMGLQTVTWLIQGEALHRDSLGTEQLITPGQLNLMTAGSGIAHAEESTGRYRGPIHGIQLWIAQPESTRHGEPSFEHLTELPMLDLVGGTGTVLIGEFGGEMSRARRDTPLIGVDLSLTYAVTVPLVTSFEYALIVLTGALETEGRSIMPGQLGYLGSGREEVMLRVDAPTRVILLGGAPFDEQILMWWNFVGRTRQEIDAAHKSWQNDDGGFGKVASDLPRILAPAPFWRSSSPS